MKLIATRTMLFCTFFMVLNIGRAQYVFDTIPSPNNDCIVYDLNLVNGRIWIDNIGNIVASTSDTGTILEKYNYSTWLVPDSVNAFQYVPLGVPSEFLGYPFDKNNNMWGGSDSVLVEINDTSMNTYSIPFYTYPSYVENLCIDDSNNVWTLMSIYDASNTTLNSSQYLIKFDGINWTKYRLIDYDTSGRLISTSALYSNGPVYMYAKNGRIYVLNGVGASIFFDGNYVTFAKYGSEPYENGQLIGTTKQGYSIASAPAEEISGTGFPEQTTKIMVYDSNDNLLFIDTIPGSMRLPVIQWSGGLQQMDNNGTYWYVNLNSPTDTIYYYNVFMHAGGRIAFPLYCGVAASGYFSLKSINFNSTRNTLLLNSTVNSTTLTNSRPNTRFMELNLDSFYSYLSSAGPVWPGDANNDHVVDNTDLLPIGLGYDSTGPVRSVQGIVWQADTVADWTNNFTNYSPAVNYKHADCNGDGIINADDTLAIVTNYGLTHLSDPIHRAWRSGMPALYLSMSPDTASNAQTVTTSILLGDSVMPVSNIYGLAFTLNFDPLVIDSALSAFSFVSSWLGSGSNSISIHKDFWGQGMIKAAITGIDHTARSGNGAIATMIGEITTGNINGKDLSYYLNKSYISDVTAIDQYGNPISLNEGSDSTYIAFLPNGIRETAVTPSVRIYPNPASNQVIVSCGSAMTSIVITDVLGNIIKTIPAENKLSESIDLSHFADGVYIIQVNTAIGTTTAKLVVTK